MIVRFKNESARPIEFRDINLYPSSTISAIIGVNECASEPLVSGAECAVIVAVKGLQPGNWRTEMLVRHTGRSRLVTARITGNVETSEDDVNLVTDLEVNPSPIDFGTLEASRPIIRSVTIRNVTADPININNIYIDAPLQSGYDLRSDCKNLASGQACIASILWSPIIEGPSSGFLVIEHDGPSAVANIRCQVNLNLVRRNKPIFSQAHLQEKACWCLAKPRLISDRVLIRNPQLRLAWLMLGMPT